MVSYDLLHAYYHATIVHKNFFLPIFRRTLHALLFILLAEDYNLNS